MKRVGIVLVMLIAITASAQDTAKEAKAMEGKWTPKSAEVAGQKLPDAQLKTITLELGKGTYTVTVGEAVDKGTVKVDATAKPKTLDIVGTDGPNKGKTILAIYEFKDDTLRVCYDLSGKNRPKDFVSSKEQPFFLAVYQRVK